MFGMSLAAEYRMLNQAGACVCDFDVACPRHPSDDCGACEYGCHCDRHGRASESCDATCHELVRGIIFEAPAPVEARRPAPIMVARHASILDDLPFE